jgi:hypothetical protein
MSLKYVTISLLCAALLDAAPAPAAAPLEQQVADLDHADPARRDAATAALISLGARAVPALEALLQANPAPELQTRARRIIDLSRGGAAVNGLVLRLASDQPRIVRGQTITLDAELVNVTDRPMNVYVGYTTGGVDFESGSALRMLAPAVVAAAEPIAPKWAVGFCGTGAHPIFKTLAPGESTSYALPLTFDAQKGTLVLGKNRYMTLGTPDPRAGVLRLRLQHAVTEARYTQFDFMPQDQRPDASLPGWTGDAQSNLIEIDLADATDDK